MPSHDPHSNRYLLLSIFVFASVLLYLTTHRPIPQPRITTPSTTPSTTAKNKSPSSLVSASEPRPLVVDRESQDGGVIQHRIVASQLPPHSLLSSSLLLCTHSLRKCYSRRHSRRFPSLDENPSQSVPRRFERTMDGRSNDPRPNG